MIIYNRNLGTKEKGFANMIILIIFLLAMCGTVLYFKNFGTSKNMYIPQDVGETKKTSGVVAVDTSAWQTYKNDMYEIKYPNDGEAVTKSPFRFVYKGNSETVSIRQVYDVFGGDHPATLSIKNIKELEDYWERAWKEKGLGSKNRKVININGSEALLLESDGGKFSNESIFVPYKSVVLNITYGYPNGKQEKDDGKIIQGIISSFKFVE